MDIKKIREICGIVSGGTPLRTNAEFWDGGIIPWIKIGDIKGKYVSDADEHITQAGLEGSSAKMLSKGTILYTIFATLGEVGILTIDACTNQAIAGITIRNKDEVLTDYLYYYLKSKKSYVNNLGRGVAQNNINLSILRDLEVPLPTLSVQRQTVDILDKTAKVIKYRQQQLQKLDNLIKARFVEMFGDPVQNSLKWVTKSLLEMGYCKNGVNFHSGDSGIEIHCLGVGDFKDYSVVDGTDYLPTISLSEEPPEESMLQDGDIVFVRSNGNKAFVGRCLVVYPHNTPTTYSGFCIRYRLTSNEVNTSYLLRVLKADSMRKKMIGRGANIQNLNQKTLATLNIPIPPMELQEQFAEFVNQTDKSKVVEAIYKANTLFITLNGGNRYDIRANEF